MKCILLFTLCVCCTVFGDDVEITEGIRYHFNGAIDGEYPIFMVLTVNDLDMSGMYYYYSIGTPIDLQGTCARDGSFMINEYIEDENNGTFKGTFVNGYASASGTWTDVSGAKKLPFSLGLVAGETVLASSAHDVTAHIPHFVGNARAMQNLIADTITGLFNKFLDDYSTDMTSEPEWEWEFICDYSIEYYSEFFTSILLEVYEYTGGAHGNVYYVSLNVIEEKGSAEFLALADLFMDDVDYGPVLSQVLINELKEQEAGWIMDGSIQTIDPDQLVFSVTPRGILFTFAPYAVGPYAEGPHFVTVDYKEVTTMIDTRGPLGRFLK